MTGDPARAALDEALGRFSAAARHPGAAALARGLSLHCAGRFAEAAPALQEALASPGPHQLRAAYTLALAVQPLGRADLAEALLRRILSATDALLAPSVALGLLLVGQGRHVEAIEVYEAALVRHPSHPDLARVVADATVAYDALGLHEEGLALCQRAIDELGAREPLLLRNLGVLYLRLDQPAPAREALRAAGAAAPWLREELGELWARWGDGGPL